MSSPAEDHGHFVKHYEPHGTVRACKYCKHTETYLYQRGAGRHAGMIGGNQARGRMIQHLKAKHPRKYSAGPPRK